jgi:hypothetical protein
LGSGKVEDKRDGGGRGGELQDLSDKDNYLDEKREYLE